MVQADILNMRTKKVPRGPGDKIVKKNARSNKANHTILLGSTPVVFDADGLGFVPDILMPEFSRLMAMRPGRFFLVDDAPRVFVAPASVPDVLDFADPGEEVAAPVAVSSPMIEDLDDGVVVISNVDEPVDDPRPLVVDQPALQLEPVVVPTAKTSKKGSKKQK